MRTNLYSDKLMDTRLFIRIENNKVIKYITVTNTFKNSRIRSAYSDVLIEIRSR